MPDINHFDFLAPIYDKVIKPQDPEWLIKLARLPVSGMVLDAGGGTGRVASVLRDFTSGFIVADLSMRMLRKAIVKEGLNVVNTSTENLPFADESFERVIMVDSFHHVVNQVITAREMWRVVIPGGWVIVEEPDIRKNLVKLIALFEKLALMRSHFLPPQTIASYFQFPGANIDLHENKFSSWVVIQKARSCD